MVRLFFYHYLLKVIQSYNKILKILIFFTYYFVNIFIVFYQCFTNNLKILYTYTYNNIFFISLNFHFFFAKILCLSV